MPRRQIAEYIMCMLQISIPHVLNSDLTQLYLIVAEELLKLIQAFLRRSAVDLYGGLTVQVCKAVDRGGCKIDVGVT